MFRDTLYIGALLHDIGKFTERSKCYTVDKEFDQIETRHPKYSAQFLDTVRKTIDFFQQLSPEIVDLVLYHQQPRNDWEKIVQLANWLSSSEREKGDTKGLYFTVPLLPIFSQLGGQEKNSLGYDLHKLSFSEIFPVEKPVINSEKYKYLVDYFLSELSFVRNEEQLLYLMEKYLWCVPAETTNYVPDISLFDHSKTTAAIALCLYDQYESGNLSTYDLNEMEKSKKEQFVFINGDFSGIQNFIFNIPSKGAAKTLKGHSVYVSLLSNAICRFIIRELNLKEANILYNGGGNFYILAPKVKEGLFLDLKRKISKLLLEVHGDNIYLALDYISLCPANFEIFNLQWEKVAEKVNEQKRKMWSEIGLQENYDLLFGPFGSGSREKEHCHLCGIEKGKRNVRYNTERNKSYCSYCESFEDLTDSIKRADCLLIKENKGKISNIETYQDIFRYLGYEYKFCRIKEMEIQDYEQAYLLNNTDFLQKGYRGYYMGAMSLPINPEERQLTFEEIANKSKGDRKLAFLKLDVDNLGSLFSEGLGQKTTISRVTTLSRMLGLYFEGYINHLIKEQQWEDTLYMVFSGGDDTFVIGPWNIILQFVELFHDHFQKFVGINNFVTFSAGICIFNYDYPLIMAAQHTEGALNKAKNYLMEGETIPLKNKICLFGEVFNWEEFERIRELKNLLLRIIENNSANSTNFGRAFLFKIGKTTLGFKKILADSLKGKVDNLRFWRLAYYLRNIAHQDADELIGQYREIVVNNLLQKSEDKKIKNIMIVPAAVKWAQMETRRERM